MTDYWMYSIDTKSVQDDVDRILASYMKKHGNPPAIVEANPNTTITLPDGIMLKHFPYVQKGLLYLTEEKEGE